MAINVIGSKTFVIKQLRTVIAIYLSICSILEKETFMDLLIPANLVMADLVKTIIIFNIYLNSVSLN